MEKNNNKKEQIRHKLLSQPEVYVDKNVKVNPKFRKFCLNQKPNMNIEEKGNNNIFDNSLLTDDESENSFDAKHSSNPIFSSSSDIQSDPIKEELQDTYCSELEDETPATGNTVKENIIVEGSESLFSTESSKKLSEEIEGRLSEHVSSMFLAERLTGHNLKSFSQPLRLESDSTILGATLSKDSSFLRYYENEVKGMLEGSEDSYYEKAEGGESPEKKHLLSGSLDDTEPNSQESLAETEKNTQEILTDTEQNTIQEAGSVLEDTDVNTYVQSDVVSISSGTCTDNEETESEESVINVSDSDEDNNVTKGSTQLDAMVSDINESLDVTSSSQVAKFFDNIPLMCTPDASSYARSFDPRKIRGSPENRVHPQVILDGIEEEIIPESDPESDYQPAHDTSPQIEQINPEVVAEVTQTSSSSSPESTVINISANIHISVNITTPGGSNNNNGDQRTTPVVNFHQSPVRIGTKRKTPVKNPTPTSPVPGPSRQTFRSPSRRNSQGKENAKDLKNIQNQKAKAANESIEVDDFTSKMLDEIYGKDQWQTPQLKAKTKKHTNKVNGTFLDFSSFNRDLIDNNKLESTRLDNPKRISVPEKHHKPTPVKKPVTAKKIVRTPALAICDSDTPSEASSSSSTDDESWKGESSPESSDSDVAQGRKSSKRRPVRTVKRVIRPPSYSASDDEIPDVWTNKPQQRVKSPLSNVLDSCEYKPKGKLPATPATGTKTKRKLFNPNKTYEEVPLQDEPEVPVRNTSRDMDHDISQIQDDALSFRFDLPLLPKAVERIKDQQTPARAPIARKVETPSSKKKNLVSGTPVKKLGFLESLDVKTSELSCDPEALRFRQNYKTLKQELTDKLFGLYNEAIFENELVAPCSWNKKLLNTAGRCHLSRVSGVRKARIELSEKVLTSADRLRCTLIHEMCHAATWIFNGEDGHGKTWKGWARKANSIFTELPKINTCHSYEIFYKYTYICKLCKAKSQAHSKSKKVENIRCKLCHGAIEILLNKMNKDGQIVSTPVRSATGFAKFVKENYSKVKRPNIGHADVMRILGEDFGKLSVTEKAKFN